MAKKQKKIEHQKDPEHFKIRRNRNGREHIDNCSTGYYKTTNRYMQVHHIVCISSVADSTIFDQLGESVGDFMFIRYCLAESEWNINDAHNCIGLPLKRAFVERSPKNWGGYPCHLVDHNPHYTENMHQDLKTNVWSPSIEQAEECKFNPKTLEPALKARSDFWRSFLVTRGEGSAACWQNRHQIPNTWYIPFSMHPGTPTKRKPPPEWKDFSGGMKKFLKKLFEAIR